MARRKNHFNIPYLWTPGDHTTQEKIRACQAEATKSHKRSRIWEDHTELFPSRDFLGDLAAAGVIQGDNRWATPGTVTPTLWSEPDKALLESTRSRLEEEILRASLLRLVPSGIPERGGFIYYTDRLDRCLIYHYEMASPRTTVTLRPLGDIDDPDILFDMDSALSSAPIETRMALKSVLVYGYKIVGHRNTMVYLDRRREGGAAGPFIDTLVLNEMLQKYLYEMYCENPALHAAAPDGAFPTVVEVGCGSGFLLASCAQNLPGLKHLVGIDVEIQAVHSAYRNVRAACSRLTAAPHPASHLICGSFEERLLPEADIVICNPPYIPELSHSGHRIEDFNATDGTELLEKVIAASGRMVRDGGFLFMIYSRLADAEFQRAIKAADLEYEILGPVDGFQVRFEVEGVLARKEWRDFLCDERELRESRGVYYHRLRCAAIHRKSGKNWQDRTGLLKRIRTLNSEFGTGNSGPTSGSR